MELEKIVKHLINELNKFYKSYEISYQRLAGSRDYFKIALTKDSSTINVEIVPILDIAKVKNIQKVHNITDFSPLHVAWLNKITQKYHKLKDEIRISKQFLKAIKCYGAESYINGFSGHVIDILTIYYGSFEKLVKSIAKWDKQTIIDVQKHFRSKQKALQSMKIKTPLAYTLLLRKQRKWLLRMR